MKKTLDKEACDALLDFGGRAGRNHTRPGRTIGAATCQCTDAMEKVFKARQEVQRKAYVSGGVEDMIFFVTRQRERVEMYREFAEEMIAFLAKTKKSTPGLAAYTDAMAEIAQEILDEYEHAKDRMKTLQHVKDVLAVETRALCEKHEPGNMAKFQDLKQRWRRVGGTQDDMVRKCHTISRSLFQQAAYAYMTQPKAGDTAREIRSRCRQILRNPDSYEIWGKY